MGYSQEFIEWTKATGLEASHSIADASLKLAPDTSNTESCEGLGYIGMTKNSEGQLFMKKPAANADGFELESFYSIVSKYVIGPVTPPTV